MCSLHSVLACSFFSSFFSSLFSLHFTCCFVHSFSRALSPSWCWCILASLCFCLSDINFLSPLSLSLSRPLSHSLTLSPPLSLSHSLSLTPSLPPSVLTAGLFPLRRKERCLPVQPPCLRVFLLCVDHCSRRKGGNPLVGCCDGVRFHSVVLLDTHTSDAMGPLVFIPYLEMVRESRRE